jgi:membrane protein
LLPGGGMDIIQAQLHTLTSNGSQTLGFALALSLATALWSANAGTKGLFDALNVVYDEREKRGYIRRTALSLAFTLGLLVFVLIAMAVVIALPVALNFVGVGETADTLLRLLRWPLLLLAVSGVLAFAYRFGPSRATARWTWVSWGSGFAAVTWVLGSAAFSWYVASFGSYNKTYGSLGAAVGFMTWIWLSAMIVLLGAELNAETEHQTAHDTTTGQPAPMGARGATKADTLPEFSRAE